MKPMNEAERFTALQRQPQWVQDMIKNLVRDRDHWKARALAGPDESDTFVASGLDDAQPLGRRPRIRFVLADGSEVEARLSADGDEVYVGTDERLWVTPHVSNRLGIRPAADR